MRLDMSIAYHPQTDGQSERTMKTLEDMHQACIIDFERNWDTHLPLVEFLYNNGYHPSVNCALFEALYGRRYRLRKASKLLPRYVGPFEIVERVGLGAYRLQEVKIDDKLYFIEKPMEIIDREVKKIKNSRIPIVKVRWNPRQRPELTWEREDEMKRKKLQLYARGRVVDELEEQKDSVVPLTKTLEAL
nr:retrotransposon protein, putative, Ty3-gypsy subclass [Tanacetum cinerariifolium]